MKVHDLTYSDCNEISHLQPAGWQDIKPFFELYSKSNFCTPIKIIENDCIIALGAAIIHDEVAWLAHIIVHESHRKKGVGRFVTQSLVEKCYQKHCSRIYLIATTLGAPVYLKENFVIETEYLFYKNIHLTNDNSVHQNINVYTEDMLNQIAHLDYQISGEKRLFHLKKHLQGALVFQNQNTIEGFYLPDFGDGLILATSKQAGLELMKLRFQTQSEAVFPIENNDAIAFLKQHNYTAYSKAKRMRYGDKKDVKLHQIFNRIGGNLG